MINIDEIITKAAKDGDKQVLEVVRLIKAEFLKAEKSGKEFNEQVADKILLKMIEQREESAKIYLANSRSDLAQKEMVEANIIRIYAPKQVSDEQVANYTRYVISEHFPNGVTMKDMKLVLAYVQQKYPTASGKVVSQIVRNGGNN